MDMRRSTRRQRCCASSPRLVPFTPLSSTASTFAICCCSALSKPALASCEPIPSWCMVHVAGEPVNRRFPGNYRLLPFRIMRSRIHIRLLVLPIMLSFVTSARAEDAAGAKQGGGKEPLKDVVQLTTGFTRAGEAYFSPDMKWIIFQANTPDQMYLAELEGQGDRIGGTRAPVRISPEKSHNTCGYFSPDG